MFQTRKTAKAHESPSRNEKTAKRQPKTPAQFEREGGGRRERKTPKKAKTGKSGIARCSHQIIVLLFSYFFKA
jgi:hypothetical protein